MIATASLSLTPSAIKDWATLIASCSYWLQVHSFHMPLSRASYFVGHRAAVRRSASPTVTGARAAAPSPILMSTSHCGSVVVKVPLEMTSPVIISSMVVAAWLGRVWTYYARRLTRRKLCYGALWILSLSRQKSWPR